LDIPLAERVPGLDTARNLRIVKEGQTYFAVVTLRRSMPEPKPIRKAVALDPNHKNFAYGVGTDGKAFEIQNLGGLRETDKRIAASEDPDWWRWSGRTKVWDGIGSPQGGGTGSTKR
jgi:transposase